MSRLRNAGLPKRSEKKLKKAKKEINATFLGDNKSLNSVKKPVVMKDSYPNGNVEAEWRLDSYDVINTEGEFVKKELPKKEGIIRGLCVIKLWRRNRRVQFWISCIFAGPECQRTD